MSSLLSSLCFPSQEPLFAPMEQKIKCQFLSQTVTSLHNLCPRLLWSLAVPCMIAPLCKVVSLLSLTLPLYLLINVVLSRIQGPTVALRPPVQKLIVVTACQGLPESLGNKQVAGPHFVLSAHLCFGFFSFFSVKWWKIFRKVAYLLTRIRDDLKMISNGLRPLIWNYI